MKEIVKKACQMGVEQAELFVMESRETSVQFENGALKNISHTESRGGALRVLRQGHLGFATTTQFDDIQPWLQGAIATTHFGTASDLEFAAPGEQAGDEPFDKRVPSLSEKEMISIGNQALDHIKQFDPNILSFCSIGKTQQTITLITSSGFEESYNKTLFSFWVGGQLIEGKNFLEAYDGIHQTNFDFDLGSYLTSVVKTFRHGRVNVPVKSGTTTVILTPKAVNEILMALEIGLSGKAVAKGTSPLKEKLQRKICDERITLFDDGTLPNAANTAPMDDEGTPTRKNSLIERGKLKNFLLDLRSAQELNMFPTGNGARVGRIFSTRSYLELPTPKVNNWVLEGGDRQFEEILFETKEAVIVDQLMGLIMSTQINGDFSGNISLGYKVEKGQIKGRVKDCMMAGNIYELLSEKHLVEISQDQRWISGLSGGTHLLPTVVLKDVNLSAK